MVGLTVGNVVGWAVGFATVGIEVGELVGIDDGMGVGVNVLGYVVGALVTQHPQTSALVTATRPEGTPKLNITDVEAETYLLLNLVIYTAYSPSFCIFRSLWILEVPIYISTWSRPLRNFCISTSFNITGDLK